MKKHNKFIRVMITLFLSFFIFTTTYASTNKLIDQDSILSISEKELIENKLTEVSDKHKVEILAVLIENLNGIETQEKANSYLNDYLADGKRSKATLLLIAKSDQRWSLVSSNKFSNKTMATLETKIEDTIKTSLSNENYQKAILDYADLVDKTIIETKKVKELFSVKRLLVSLGIGSLIGLIMASGTKSSLKTVRKQSGAKNYLVDKKIDTSLKNDLYLYEKVSKKPKKKKAGVSSEGKF